MKLKSVLAGSVLSTPVPPQSASAGEQDRGIPHLGAISRQSADEWRLRCAGARSPVRISLKEFLCGCVRSTGPRALSWPALPASALPEVSPGMSASRRCEPLPTERRLSRREPNPEAGPPVRPGRRALPQLGYYIEAPDWGRAKCAIRSRV